MRTNILSQVRKGGGLLAALVLCAIQGCSTAQISDAHQVAQDAKDAVAVARANPLAVAVALDALDRLAVSHQSLAITANLAHQALLQGTPQDVDKYLDLIIRATAPK